MSLLKTFETSYKKEFNNIVKQAEKILIDEAPKDTGALADSITTEQKGYYVKVGVDPVLLKSDARNIGRIDYSWYVWKGHKAYTITPRASATGFAQALRWVDKDGTVRFAKSVRIPASKGNDFVGRALKRVEQLGG